MNILVVGGTGFVGSQVALLLAVSGHDVTVTTRRHTPAPLARRMKQLCWDGMSIDAVMHAVEGSDVVCNFAGTSIAGSRWTPQRKQDILLSRIRTTAALVEAMAQSQRKPAVLVSASAVGYYGDTGNALLDEHHPRGGGFLAEVCARWEDATAPAVRAGIRVVTLRMGIVVGRGGAVPKMAMPFRFCVGGTLGSGRQWLSWIHIHDVAGIVRFVIDSPSLSGPMNCCSPDPVTMRAWCEAIAGVVHRPSWVPVPAIALRAVLGEMAEMLLFSQRAIPAALQRAGFHFTHPSLHSALGDALA